MHPQGESNPDRTVSASAYQLRQAQGQACKSEAKSEAKKPQYWF